MGRGKGVKMHWNEFIESVSTQTSYTKREIRRFLRVTAETIIRELEEGRDLCWRKLGTFRNMPAHVFYYDFSVNGGRYRAHARRIRFVPDRDFKARIKESNQKFIPKDITETYLPKEEQRGEIRRSNRPGEAKREESYRGIIPRRPNNERTNRP